MAWIAVRTDAGDELVSFEIPPLSEGRYGLAVEGAVYAHVQVEVTKILREINLAVVDALEKEQRGAL